MTHPAFVGQRLLIADDEPLIAMDVQRLLEQEGANVIPASSVTQALRVVDASPLSAGIIDIRLEEDAAAPICDALYRRRVPFHRDE